MPDIKFDQPIFHPNVEVTGKICREMIEWNPSKKVRDILEKLLNLLVEPDLNSSLNHEATTLYK
jgi:ubiquitin-protein ligase